MKTSALRRWLRALRTAEHLEFMAHAHENLPPPPSSTSWFMLSDGAPMVRRPRAAGLARFIEMNRQSHES